MLSGEGSLCVAPTGGDAYLGQWWGNARHGLGEQRRQERALYSMALSVV